MKKVIVSVLLVVSSLLFVTYLNTAKAADLSLLPSPWHLTGNNGDAQAYQSVSSNILSGQDKISLSYNLHGLCALPGDASAIIFDQNGWKFISLSDFGKNCKSGEQIVDIPLSEFVGLDTTKPLTGVFHTRFWNDAPYDVTIRSAIPFKSGGAEPAPIPTPSPSNGQNPIPTPTPVSNGAGTWAIQSVDAMKDTKDTICGQRDRAWIDRWVGKAVELGANYVSISTPYENPSCGDAQVYTRRWVDAIRARGLKVWFRQMPLAFEGIYSVAKNNSNEFLSLIGNYIKANADMYQPGDIFTPIPEPQNGGVAGVTYCAQGVCQFSGAADFNAWLRGAMATASQAFQTAGKTGMKVGYFGFDGFTVWGDNNPDWRGILEDATVEAMGNITIDHYPEIVSDTMANDLAELHTRYPNVDIIIGEWGTITGGDTVTQVKNSLGAAKAAPYVKGFNYWQFGPGGAGEQLINDDFTSRIQFAEVQKFYKGI